MLLIQQNSISKSFFAILAFLCLTFITPIEIAQAQITIAQSSTSNYDKYMRRGYAATAKKDYRTALINFRSALSIRPGDRYANNAIRNVSSYARRPNSKFTYRPVPTGIGSPGGGSRVGAGSRLARINSSPDGIETSDSLNDIEFETNSNTELNQAAPQTQVIQSCAAGEKRLTALVPETQTQQSKTILGLTSAEYPVLFFYVPPNRGQFLELALVDITNKKQKYQLALKNPKTSGIISVNLSQIKNLPALEVGKNYHWYFSIVCDGKNRSQDEVVDGFVQRVKLDPTLEQDIQKASERDRVSIYFINNLWYDSIGILAQLRQASPNDSSLVDEWANLLGGIGLDSIAREPLVQPSYNTVSKGKSQPIINHLPEDN